MQKQRGFVDSVLRGNFFSHVKPQDELILNYCEGSVLLCSREGMKQELTVYLMPSEKSPMPFLEAVAMWYSSAAENRVNIETMGSFWLILL